MEVSRVFLVGLLTLALGWGDAAVATGAAGSRLPDHLRGVHDAKQIVLVTASSNATSYGTVRGYRKRNGSWHRVLGPWPARLGARGFAQRGEKREGDGQTPTGSYHFSFMFGVAPDPGTRFAYRRALSTSRWDDDSSSANYNRWVDTRYGDPGASPENMRVLPNYRYGAAIGYNLARTPGRGSAIFFHVTDGTDTAGCVAVARSHIVKLLRWLRPSLKPRIIMGKTSAVTR